MDEIDHPSNTREFMAMWNSVTAEHMAHKLSGVLRTLPERLPDAPLMNETQATALAAVLVRALQVAASPEGGAHAAVQFLSEYRADAST